MCVSVRLLHISPFCSCCSCLETDKMSTLGTSLLKISDATLLDDGVKVILCQNQISHCKTLFFSSSNLCFHVPSDYLLWYSWSWGAPWWGSSCRSDSVSGHPQSQHLNFGPFSDNEVGTSWQRDEDTNRKFKCWPFDSNRDWHLSLPRLLEASCFPQSSKMQQLCELAHCDWLLQQVERRGDPGWSRGSLLYCLVVFLLSLWSFETPVFWVFALSSLPAARLHYRRLHV